MAEARRHEAQGDRAPEVGVRLLGPVQLHIEGIEVSLGAAGPLTLFSVLAAQVGTAVSVDELVEALWGGGPPKSAGGVVYTYVSLLRKALAQGTSRPAKAGLLTSTRAGYRLEIPAEAVDLHRFETAAARARGTRVEQGAAAMLEHCHAALAAWSGPPLWGATGPYVAAERARLELDRLDLQELRCAALLATGSSGEAAAELLLLTERNPLREQLHELLMLALYRTGRQADALRVYKAVRERLVAELGIEPGPALRQMHQLVLSATEAQDTLAPLSSHTTAEPVAAGTGVPQRQHAGVVVPAQLPHTVAGLIGRDDELVQLERLCTAMERSGHSHSAVISAIDGVGGVGKTALAIHAAHLMADSFPDGQLFVDLRGFDPRLPPVTPGDALGHLLRGLSADVGHVYDGDVDAQAALYRSMLAGRRVLVVLDNAVSAEQVRPLLPGSPGCLALVTSRDRLTGLVARDGAVRISLGVLSPECSAELLRRGLGAAVVDSAPDEARELAALCGHLPLALRIASERIASSEHCELADMVRQLRGEHDRLDALSLADDEYAAVRTVFSWSYRALERESAQTFRLLGLHPGVEFGIEDAAALLDCSTAAALGRVDSLVSRHLLEEVARHRYRFFDLIRIYAAERAERDERSEITRSAVERLLRRFLGCTVSVRAMLVPGLAGIGPVEPDLAVSLPGLRTYDEAIGWIERELPTLCDAVRLAVDQGFDALAAQLAATLGALFCGAGRWAQWLRVIDLGLEAARRVGDKLSEARLNNDRALACYFLGRHDEAVACHRATIDILSRPDVPRSATVTATLAVAYSILGRELGELHLLETALGIAREQDDVTVMFVRAVVCDNYGAALSRAGRHDEAVGWGRGALKLIRRLGAAHMLGHTLIRVGETCLRAGRTPEAIGHLDEALELWRGRGNVWGETTGMRALAKAWLQAGDPEHARELLLGALAIMRETGRMAADEHAAAEITTLLDQLPGPGPGIGED